MLSCKEVTRLASERLDRQLPFWTRVGVRLHVMMCEACRSYRRQLDAIDRLLADRFRGDSSALNSIPDALSPESIARFKAALRNG